MSTYSEKIETLAVCCWTGEPQAPDPVFETSRGVASDQIIIPIGMRKYSKYNPCAIQLKSVTRSFLRGRHTAVGVVMARICRF